MTDVWKGDAPSDRMTRMCDAAVQAFEAHPEHRDDDRCIVFLNGQERAGIVLHGYEDQTDAMVDLLMHLKAIFEANGKTLAFLPMQDPGSN